jgi:glycosyltransferase involved in cell wall biosynthesis
LRIGIDATYSVGSQLTGVGVYSRELIRALGAQAAEAELRLCYRPHRLLRGLVDLGGTRTRLITESRVPRCDLFHGLNQRLPGRAALPRVVVTFHDLFVLTGEYSTPEFRTRFADQARRAAARADLVIAVSRFTADQVHNLLGVPEDRLRVIHHGVSPPPVEPAHTSREPLILTAGAIQTRKNTARLIEAFEQTPAEWRLVIAGSRGFGAEEILARIERSPRRPDISVAGYLPASELENLYRRASIFAFPSLDEGFGMPVLDAMARGLPVVTSNRSALPEVAGDAAMLVDPASTSDIAQAMLRLCSDSGLREEMAAQAKRRAAGFSWERAAQETWLVYRELLG